VFPTPVGMNRNHERDNLRAKSVPHARGDEPDLDEAMRFADMCSPRPWG